MKHLRVLFSTAALLTVVGVGAASPALADAGKPVVAEAAKKPPKARVAFDQSFARWLISPRGHIEGMLLADGAEVRIPRGYDVDPKLQPGDVVHVEAIAHAMTDGTLYFRPTVRKGLDVIVDASGKPQQAAQPGAKVKLQPMKVTGAVAGFLLDGADRHVGVVLADGTEAWVHGHADLAALGVKKGETLTIQGPGGAYTHGTALFAEKLTLADGKVVEVPSPKWKGAADKK